MTDIQDDGVLVAKIISALTLFGVSVLFGIVPFKLAQIFKWSEPIDPNSKSNKKSSRVVSILLCFGGGVLLATTFLHLLPEINEEILALQHENKIPEMNFAIGELLMLSGFFLIYLIEEIVHNFLHRYQEKMKRSQSIKKLEEETFGESFIRGIAARNSVHRRFSDGNGIPLSSSSHEPTITDGNIDTKTLSVIVENGQKKTNGNLPSELTHSQSNGHGHDHSHGALPVPHSDEEDVLVSSLRGLLIVLALSIHELFEGFAVGLQATSFGVYYMFAAVAAHKFVISFCIGVELMVQRTKLWLAFLYVFVYSFVSALGGFFCGWISEAVKMTDLFFLPVCEQVFLSVLF